MDLFFHAISDFNHQIEDLKKVRKTRRFSVNYFCMAIILLSVLYALHDRQSSWQYAVLVLIVLFLILGVCGMLFSNRRLEKRLFQMYIKDIKPKLASVCYPVEYRYFSYDDSLQELKDSCPRMRNSLISFFGEMKVPIFTGDMCIYELALTGNQHDVRFWGLLFRVPYLQASRQEAKRLKAFLNSKDIDVVCEEQYLDVFWYGQSMFQYMNPNHREIDADGSAAWSGKYGLRELYATTVLRNAGMVRMIVYAIKQFVSPLQAGDENV